MSITTNRSIPAKEFTFREELAKLPLPERTRKIDYRLAELKQALSSRNEKLLALRPCFDQLTLDFLGQLPKPPPRYHPLIRDLVLILLVIGLIVEVVYGLDITGNAPMAFCVGAIGVCGISALCFSSLTRRAPRITSQEQEPFWLTGGAIALSNLGITPPADAKWWWKDQVVFVFVRHISVRFSIDAVTGELIWEDPVPGNGFSGARASQILKDLLNANSRYRQMVSTFQGLAGLENDLTFLADLKAETDQAVAAKLHEAQRKTAEASQTRSASPRGSSVQAGPANAQKASWETLIVPKSLRQNLQAYCRILRDFEAYQAQGVHLPKGLLFHGPAGCGKTQIAKTLSAEGGLNFVSLSTSDCKQKFIGWSAEKLKTVFAEARAKQPGLIFIDEIDAVTPPRGMYHDAIAQEATAQLLQEIDGMGSDGQAVFICAATNRPDHVDSAMLSRFAERIEIPLPDEPTRRALLEVFLGAMRFVGDRHHVFETLAKSSAGRSGRDLRNLVNAAVLSAVKRTSSPKDFALTTEDLLPDVDQKTRVTPAATVAPSAPAPFQLDSQVRQDSISALITLGFPKRQAQSRVDAVTVGSTSEQIIKAALQGGR